MASDDLTGIAAIRAGLAANLEALRAGGFDGTISPYQLSNVSTPAIEIGKGPTEYDETMERGSDFVTMYARVYVALSTDEEAQALLDTYLDPLGPLSVKTALETDRTLGGACADLIVRRDDGHQLYGGDAGGVLLGSSFTVEVYT